MEVVGVEPTMPEAADLQSAGVTNFPTLPYLVPQERLELSHLAIPEPKSGVSTNSTNGALLYLYFGGPSRTCTRTPQIMSLTLYYLSYRPNVSIIH